MQKIAIVIVLLTLLASSLACSMFNQLAQIPTVPPTLAMPEFPTPVPEQPQDTQPAPATQQVEATLPAPQPTGRASPELRGPAFASYDYQAPEIPAAFPPSYSLPLDLSQVKGMDQVTLSNEQNALLAQNGFVVTAPAAGQYNEFYQLYESQRYSEQPIFATTDAVYHAYHLIFDKMLRDLERDSFSKALNTLTSTLLAATSQQYQAVKGTQLEGPALRNVAFFGVAAMLLGLPDAIPAEAQQLVDAEVGLIEGHTGPAVSPIWDREDLDPEHKLIEDYSQYIPRGHYTRSEELQKYFKAMMWYGRLTFRLRDAFETQRALLLTQALRSATAPDGTPALDLWKNIYEPTVFIVGKTDDLSYFEYGNISDQVFGAGNDPQAFADSAKLAQFVELARQLPPPQVNSMWVWINEDKTEATQGFRFMGQRFTLDEYVFGQLIWRNVGTLDKPRGLPKGLDFFAALGSQDAYETLNAMGETGYANYDKQMDKVRKEIADLGLDSWTQNLYWSWLYSFQPLIGGKDGRFPPFMQNLAWRYKELNTALGSWTELKHDTLLYAKQVMAEMGGGEPASPPHGYVEPNPEAYARLLALAKITRDGLQSRNLLSTTTQANLENLMDLLDFMKNVSEQELAGNTLSDENYWRIQYFGGELEALTLAASDCAEADPSMCRDLSDQKAAIVADVATGINPDGSLSVLEEGVGQPTLMYVILPDEPYRLATGAAYSYYEFEVPPEQRMTDEQWQSLVEQGNQPELPAWTGTYLAP